MNKFKSCSYGGGEACLRQGGNSAPKHHVDYAHSFPSAKELGEPVGDFTQPLAKAGVRTVILSDLNGFFDEDLSKSVLSLPFSQIVSVDRLVKSMYEFDLDSPQGIVQLMELLPVLDPAIMKDVMEEIWPGYVAEDVDPDMLRAEIAGYLRDYIGDSLEGMNEEEIEASSGTSPPTSA